MKRVEIEPTSEIEPRSREKRAIIVFGRGVGVEVEDLNIARDEQKRQKVIDSVKSGARVDLMKPTHVLEKAVVRDPSKGNFGPEDHPTFNWPVDVTARPNSTWLTEEPGNSRYAGAEYNVKAAAELVRQTLVDGKDPVVFMAAGRTEDMKKWAPDGWSQGMINAKELVNHLINGTKGLERVTFVFEPENENSYHDAMVSLIGAQEMGCKEATLVTVGIHMKRSRILTEEVRKGMENSDRFQGQEIIKVDYRASEPFVMKESEEKKAEVRVAAESLGHNVTLAREMNGVKGMKSGNYHSQYDDGSQVTSCNKRIDVMSVEEVRNFK